MQKVLFQQRYGLASPGALGSTATFAEGAGGAALATSAAGAALATSAAGAAGATPGAGAVGAGATHRSSGCCCLR